MVDGPFWLLMLSGVEKESVGVAASAKIDVVIISIVTAIERAYLSYPRVRKHT